MLFAIIRHILRRKADKQTHTCTEVTGF